MPDRVQRQIAVDPQRSVIVQAPAGSGKTSLLVERYLGLLSVVDAPEEILAITFTRKAAAEMRERILLFLDPAYVPSGAHEESAVARARAAAEKVAEWELRENPQRLLIRTIDSFSHYLASAMPVASQLGPVPTPAENTQALYRETARRVLSRSRAGDELAHDLERLLLWRDNRSQYLEDLLVELLGRREQWLRALSVSGQAERSVFEGVVRDIVVDRLSAAHKTLEQGLSDAGIAAKTLLDLLDQAALSLQAEGKPSPLDDADLSHLPGADPADLTGWKALGFALLTQDGDWLKKPNKRQGFPPKSAHKDGIMIVLERLQDNTGLARLIHRARTLPEPRYDDQEWEVLAALMRVLEASAVELELVFAETGQSDFTGIAQAALRGLGDAEHGYTDLALYLDGQIRHILVDEYQDTNWGQYHLLEKLMAGWEPGEGRSLFLVGDPMQSIYRFREAEVGLFMHSRKHGIGQQRLEACQLTRNFRSASEIVTWVNQRLGPIFPKVEDVSAGAVSYAPSDPARGPGGQVETLAWPDNAAEAEGLASRISALLDANSDPEFKAAIIVRARSHLADIVPALERHGVAYRAVKLDPLLSRPVVQDLLALTRAIINPADISAVLAVLRAPYCGLSLAQLHAVTGSGSRVLDAAALECLDPDGQARAARVFDVLDRAQTLWQRRSLRDLVEGAWSALGGPATLTRPEAGQREAEAYLDALASAEDQGLLADWNAFIEMLGKQHTEGEAPSDDVRLELLTMHGAKGLEWDLVILPGLNRRPATNSGELLYWLPFTSGSGQERVLIAPLRSAEQDDNTELIKLIRAEQDQREASEMQRLLYVAATRARQHLLLSTALDPDPNDDLKPTASSLLAELWPGCSEDFKRSLKASASQNGKTDPGDARPAVLLRRIRSDWQPEIGQPIDWQPALPARERAVDIEFDWAGIQARRIGTVLHRLLEHVGRIGIEKFDPTQRRILRERIPGLLQAMGTGSGDLPAAVQLVSQAFEQTLDSKTGRWILSGSHHEAACELPLSGIVDGALVNAIIDRSFIDENRQRWIIDYKSGYHDGGDLQGFLDAEARRYAPQLELYRRLFEQMGEGDIRAALYLPRHDRLVVID